MNAIVTEHVRFTRGQTFAFTRTVRDQNSRLRDLTGAVVYFAMRADIKIAPTVKLISTVPAFLALAAGVVVEAFEAGNDILVTMVGDAGGAITIAETLVTSGLTQTHRLVTIHFKDGVSTNADLEAAIAASSTLLQVKTTGTGATVLTAGHDNVSNAPLASGAPDGWRTGIEILAQSGATLGQFTVTLIPDDTTGLIALGDDDPWLYDVWVDIAGDREPNITTSRVALYPEIATLP